MIQVEKLSFSYTDRELYHKISFSIEEGQHCALIGSNGTGKTTLADMLMRTEEYLYDGKIRKEPSMNMAFVSQFAKRQKDQEVTVYDYLCEDFVTMQAKTMELCTQMETAEDLEEIFEQYQKSLDEFQAVDGDNYESNIKKQLKLAGLQKLEELPLKNLSGGEFKLVQVIRQMLRCPDLLIMDEPDVFLDFENLNGLRDLINAHRGTLLVITHNRYILNHCFNKILHLEGQDLQEFEGGYIDYNLALLQKKIELQELAAEDRAEIERNQKLVDRLREDATMVDSATKGRTLHARVSFLERLEARRIKEPFVEIREPQITLPKVEVEEEREAETLLNVENYHVAFEEELLNAVTFALKEHEKVAIVGPNGTGKTTLLRAIYRNQDPAIRIDPSAKIGFLSQMHGEMLTESNTVYKEFEPLGFEREQDLEEYLKGYCFEADTLSSRIETLSGGEKNLLQIAKIALTDADLLLLDEPTSHLDTYAQIALEKALERYQGAVLMVSHDFYHIANCADHILFVEDRTIRQMSNRAFRKMIYKHHFSKEYLELEQKKKELETKIQRLLLQYDFESAKAVCEELEAVVAKM